MKQLYLDNDLSVIIHIIYTYIEPIYTCELKKKPNSSASFACVAKVFNDIHHTYFPVVYEKCSIDKKINLCRIHCKAYPICKIIYQQSNISTLQYHRGDKSNQFQLNEFYERDNDYMHFSNKYIARFAPHILTNIKFIRTCCDGKGWAWVWSKVSKKTQDTTFHCHN